MFAALRNRKGELTLEQRCADETATLFCRYGVDCMDVGIAAAEGNDPVGTAPRGLYQPVPVRGVVGNDGDAFSFQSFENLGLGVGDCRFGAKIFDMSWRNCGDERDMRANFARQGSDFALVAHTHFQDRKLGVARHPGKAEGHAGMVVVTFRRSMNLARPVALKRSVKRLLRACLSNRAGNSKDHCLTSLTRSSSERLKRFETVVDQHMR